MYYQHCLCTLFCDLYCFRLFSNFSGSVNSELWLTSSLSVAGDPIVPVVSRGVEGGSDGGRIYTAQRTYKIARKCTMMDVSEEPVIVSFFSGDIQEMVAEAAGLFTLLAILNKAECPWSFTAKDSITHNPLLLLQTKWTTN